MSIDFSQLASQMFSGTGIKPPESLEDVIAAARAGITPEQARVYREFVLTYNGKIQARFPGEDRSGAHFYQGVNKRINTIFIPEQQNLSVRDHEIELNIEAKRSERLIQEALTELVQADYRVQNCEVTPNKQRRNKSVSEPVVNADTAYEHDAFDGMNGLPVTLDATISKLASLRTKVEGGSAQDDIVKEINVIIAMAQRLFCQATKPNRKAGNIFPDWTEDGWKLELRERRTKANFPENFYADEEGKKPRMHKETTSLDIQTPRSKFNPKCYYYVYAYACNSRGTEKYLYIGTYDDVEKVVQKSGILTARTEANPGVYAKLDGETLAWRQKQAKERGMIVM